MIMLVSIEACSWIGVGVVHVIDVMGEWIWIGVVLLGGWRSTIVN